MAEQKVDAVVAALHSQDAAESQHQASGESRADLTPSPLPILQPELGEEVIIGDGFYQISGQRFRRRQRPIPIAKATFLTQLDALSKDIDIEAGDVPYTESRVPTREESFATITKTTAEYIRSVSAVYERGGHVLIEGPTGSGKTTLAKTVCHLANRNATEITFSGDTKTKDFMWYDILTDTTNWQSGEKKKTVVRVPGPLLEAMVSGDTLIVNEGNMMPSDLQSLFFQVMDTGQILFSDFEQLRVFYKDRLPKAIPGIPVLEAKKGFQLIVTINPGYIGTEVINKAWERRFKRHGGLIEMGYIPEEEEIQAVISELEARNAQFGSEIEVNPAIVKLFVAASHNLRNGSITYEEGDPPQTRQRVDEALKVQFQELVSTRTIIYWIENYSMNDLSAKEACERTFLVSLDERDRRDKELKERALTIIDRQIDQFVGGELAFLEELEKAPFEQAITASFEDRKALDIRQAQIDGVFPVVESVNVETTQKSEQELLDEADAEMMRYLRMSSRRYAQRLSQQDLITETEHQQAKEIINHLATNGLAGEEAQEQKLKLRSLLKLEDDTYQAFLQRVENIYKRVLRRKGLLKDTLPIKDVEIPSSEHVLAVLTKSSLANLQIIDNALRRGKIVKLRGPTGAGKSSLGRTWAYLRGRRLVEYPFSGETKQSDFGYKTTLVEGETKISIQFLYKAMQKGYAVMINEFNMAWPEVVTAFNNVADKGRKIRLPDGREIKIHPDFVLIYTENPPDPRHSRSPQYAGAKPQNQAVENRCGVNMWLGYPPEDEEAAILHLVNPRLSDKFTSDLIRFVGDIRIAVESSSVSDQTKEVLRRFSMSTDELIQLVKRNGSDKDVVLELTKVFNGFSQEQKRVIAAHMARFMPLLEES